MADPLFEGWKGILRIGDGPEIPVCGPPVFTFVRGSAPWPLPAAGSLRFEAGFPARIDLDAWAGFRGACCPGCDRPWAELPPGHTWSSADGVTCSDAEATPPPASGADGG